MKKSWILGFSLFTGILVHAQDPIEIRTNRSGTSTPAVRLGVARGDATNNIATLTVRDARVRLGSGGFLNVERGASALDTAGDVRYDSVNGTLRCYHASAWTTMATSEFEGNPRAAILQTATPGTTQTGHLTIAGTAMAGTLKLPNSGWLVGRNAANTADLNLLRLNSSNNIHFGSGSIVLDPGNEVTISAINPAAPRTFTLPNIGANANFVMTEGAQTINGDKTFGGTLAASGSALELVRSTNSSTITGSAAVSGRRNPTGVASGDFYGVLGEVRFFDNSDGYQVNNDGVRGEASGNTSVAGGLTSNRGVHGVASGSASAGFALNYGVFGQAWGGDTNWGGYFRVRESSANTVLSVLGIERETTGTAAAGIGAALEFIVRSGNGTTETPARITGVLTANTPGAEEGELIFSTLNAGGGPAERMRLASDGTLLIGTTTDADALLRVGSTTGSRLQIGTAEYLEDGGVNTLTTNASLVPSSDGTRSLGTTSWRWDAFLNELVVEADTNPVTINETGTDGVLIRFQNDGVNSGSISQSGSTVSYNAFTGSHYGWSSAAQDLLPGAVLVATGANRKLGPDHLEVRETIYGVDTTERACDPRVLGVYGGSGGEGILLVNAVGDGFVLVTDSAGDIDLGDYLTSSARRGFGQRQPSAAMMNYTLARAMESVRWADVPVDPKRGFRWKRIACTFRAG